MSFRYINQLTAKLKQRLLATTATRTLLGSNPSFSGDCHGVRVTVNASGTVTAIAVVDAAVADAALHVIPQKKASSADDLGDAAGDAKADAAQPIPSAEKVAMAVRVATWAAQRRRLDAVRAVHRQAHAELRKDRYGAAFKPEERFDVEDAASAAAPRAWESIRDGPTLAALAGDAKAPGASSLGVARAELPLVLASNADWAPALLPLTAQDPATGKLRDAKAPVDEGAFPTPQAYAEARAELSMCEASFWDRVDLIKKAQTNTVQTDAAQTDAAFFSKAANAQAKAPYQHHAETRPLGTGTDYSEKIALKFVE